MKKMLVALGLGAVMLSGNALGGVVKLKCDYSDLDNRGIKTKKEFTEYYMFSKEDGRDSISFFDKDKNKWERGRRYKIEVSEGAFNARRTDTKLSVYIDRRTGSVRYVNGYSVYSGECSPLEADPVLAKPKF